MIEFQPKSHNAHPRAHLGRFFNDLDTGDARPAIEQLGIVQAALPEVPFTFAPSGDLEDPSGQRFELLFEGKLRDETIRVFDSAWATITQPDGDFVIFRVD